MECQEQEGVQIQGQTVKDLPFAEDIDLLAQSENDLQGQVTTVFEESQRFGLQINKKKTKVMVMNKKARQDKDIQITIDNEKLEVISQYI
jgi:hypothetical protein